MVDPDLVKTLIKCEEASKHTKGHPEITGAMLASLYALKSLDEINDMFDSVLCGYHTSLKHSIDEALEGQDPAIIDAFNQIITCLAKFGTIVAKMLDETNFTFLYATIAGTDHNDEED